MKPIVSLIVTDLDNTLYDWVRMWYQSFSVLIDLLTKESGVSKKTLEAEIQTVFQQHGTSEYGFVVEELPSLKSKYPNDDLSILYKDVMSAFINLRKSSLYLYPGVRETLDYLKKIGAMIVVFTESMSFYTIERLVQLKLDGIVDFVYSSPNLPNLVEFDKLNRNDSYRLKSTVHRLIPTGTHKPDPYVLLDIINDDGVNASKEQTIYIGDSLMKDVKMAQDAGVTDVYAKYGLKVNSKAYEVLRRVTHWTKEEVERERKIISGGIVTPTYTLKNSFKELLSFFEFVSHARV